MVSPQAIPPNVTDLRGRVFGRLTVRDFIGARNGKAYWSCDCECGTIGKEVRGKNLIAWEKAGRAISCGCYRSDPLVRQAARLTMSQESRSAAAAGQQATPRKPDGKPKPEPAKRILPFVGDRAPEELQTPAGGTVPQHTTPSMRPARDTNPITPAAPDVNASVRHIKTRPHRRAKLSANREAKTIAAVACPHCGAPVGVACYYGDSKIGFSPARKVQIRCHADRRRAWQDSKRVQLPAGL